MDARKNISIIKKGYENKQGMKAGIALEARIILVTSEIFNLRGGNLFLPTHGG